MTQVLICVLVELSALPDPELVPNAFLLSRTCWIIFVFQKGISETFFMPSIYWRKHYFHPLCFSHANNTLKNNHVSEIAWHTAFNKDQKNVLLPKMSEALRFSECYLNVCRVTSLSENCDPSPLRDAWKSSSGDPCAAVLCRRVFAALPLCTACLGNRTILPFGNM